MAEPVIRCENVSFAYGPTPVVRNVSFEVPTGKFVGLVGPNGCGKSTMMRLLLGVLEPTAGAVSVLGARPREAVRSGEIGYVPQRETFQRSFPLAVRDVVLMGRAGRIGLGRRPCRHDRRAADEALERFGLGELRRWPFSALSGGQQRLVLLCRALAQEPRVLFMDEADTGLDELRREKIYRELHKLRADTGLTILAISHQLDLLATVVDSALAMQDGRAVDWCPTCMHHALGSAQPVHRSTAS